LWFEVPFIYLERGNTQIRETLGLNKKTKYARLSDFITPAGIYKIREQVSEAQKENVKNKFQKDLIKIDRRVGLLYSAIGGGILKILSSSRMMKITNGFHNQKPLELILKQQILFLFVNHYLFTFSFCKKQKKQMSMQKQIKYWRELKPSKKNMELLYIPQKKNRTLEILYNKFQPFLSLSKYYGYLSLLLIVFVIAQIFMTKKMDNTFSLKF